MQSARIRRLGATAFAVLAIGTGAVATAAPAVAQSDWPGSLNNNVIIRDIALAPNKAVTVGVTYVCERTPELYMSVSWELADRDWNVDNPRGSTSIHKLTCDEEVHDIQVTMPAAADSLPFGKGDAVRSEVDLSSLEGLPYAYTKRVKTL
ncbi:hypothetical protein [Streptomyces sp. NPDC003077]|uniref:hypothetical protein n=1 Tax=Streptomyces sp. NPDC003077 TaxID=3154443 RepID=UPI0033AFB722